MRMVGRTLPDRPDQGAGFRVRPSANSAPSLGHPLPRGGFHSTRRDAQTGRTREPANQTRRISPAEASQFLKLWIGAGMRPPRVTNASHETWFTGMIGA